jgi:3-phenylpropionate/trans-cinnamate dioxygenase ferredoxin reductase subunit
MKRKTFAIVGASLAGAHAAHQLRRDGFDGRIVLIGAERHLPYDRPPLSKSVLVGEAEPATTALWSESDYAEADIDVLLATRVTRIRPAERVVELDNGLDMVADQILLCTGSYPRKLRIPGLEQQGVFALRTLDDSVRLHGALLPGASVVVIGFGFIGAEVAAAAVKRGCEVKLVEAAALPMQRVLGSEVAQRYCDLHREHGVDIHLNAAVGKVRGNGRCQSVVLANGCELPADVVVYGVGASPSTELAETAGIEVDNGVVVDARCQTSIDGIFACGDVAIRPSTFSTGNIRLETWQNAYRQGMAAAKAMLGSKEPFDELPWFWTDQYDVKMQLAGLCYPSDEVIWRGAQDSFDCLVFYISESRVRAVLGFNRPRDVRAVMHLIRKQVPVNSAELGDEWSNLTGLSSCL